jgi:hypothetical protein
MCPWSRCYVALDRLLMCHYNRAPLSTYHAPHLRRVHTGRLGLRQEPVTVYGWGVR